MNVGCASQTFLHSDIAKWPIAAVLTALISLALKKEVLKQGDMSKLKENLTEREFSSNNFTKYRCLILFLWISLYSFAPKL